MLAAIVGDVVGSRHESTGNKRADVQLLNLLNGFTDDTVCTTAIAQWLLEDPEQSPGSWLRSLSADHFERGFGANYLHWVRNPEAGEQSSYGNGAAMRVSPVAYWAASDNEATQLAVASTHPTHLHAYSAEGAQATVWAIRHAWEHQDPQRLLKDASALWSYGDLASRDPILERADHQFDITVQGTVPLAIVLAARGGSFEGALRLAISMGGDSDTLAAIAAPIAEGLYGLHDELAEACLRRMEFWFDPRFYSTLVAFYEHPRVQSFYARHGRTCPPVAQWAEQGPLF
jgi:hypothetical protein